MRTIVVDDEPWMLQRLCAECGKIPDVQLLGSFRSPAKALAFARENRVELSFLDLEMPGMSGLELAAKLREITPELIVIFVSAYESHMAEAFCSKAADYYIMKPYNIGDVEAAVDRARLLSGRLRKKVAACTFGAFNLFVDQKPVAFPDDKTRELLALLIDRRGGALSVQTACTALCPESASDESAAISCRKVFRALEDALKAARLSGVIDRDEQGWFVHTDIMDCDLFQFMDGDLKTMRQFTGEYMTGYGWAEPSRQNLLAQKKLLERYNDEQTRNTLCASIRHLNDGPMTLTYMNEGFLAVVGFTRDEIQAVFHDSLSAMIVPDDIEPLLSAYGEAPRTGALIEHEYRLTDKSGGGILVLAQSELPGNPPDNKPREISSILIDISGLKAEQKSLGQASNRDALTGLYGRESAQQLIQRSLRACCLTRSCALILMDVDGFKAVNDTYGRSFADTVLTDVAAILTRSFRSTDIICRLGGDEMMIFLTNVAGDTEARAKLRATEEAIATRLKAKTEKGELSCSFGGVLSPEDGSDFDTLYQRADLALSCAKERKACSVWFSDVRMRVVDKLVAREVTAIDSHGAPELLTDEIRALLSRPGSLPDSIAEALSIIGRKYDISRAYVFETADDQNMAVNTFEWCAAHAEPEIQHLQALPIEAVTAYYEALFKNNGVLYCYDIRTLSEDLYGILAPQGIKSVLQCALGSEGQMFGMVGFDECRERRYWNGRQLKALSEFAGVLSKALIAYRRLHGHSLAALQQDARGLRETAAQR